MGRRSSKAGQSTGETPGFETVGVTILPGHPLPEWMTDAPGADAVADPALVEAGRLEAGGAMASGSDPAAGVAVGSLDAPASSTVGYPTGDLPGAVPDPRQPALVGAAAGAAMAAAAAPAPSPYAANSFPPSPLGAGSVHPGAGSVAGLGAPSPYAPTSPTAGVGSPPHAAMGSPYAASPAMGGVGSPYAATAPTGHAGQPPTHPAAVPQAAGQPGGQAPYGPSGHLGSQSAGPGTATMPAPSVPPTSGPGAAGPTTVDPGSAAQRAAGTELPTGHAAPSTDLSGQPPAPSAGWTSPDRPELSPEHVALLTWWADMIAKGQFPAPNGAPGAFGVPGSQGPDLEPAPERPSATRRTPRAGAATGRRRNAKVVALSLIVVAVGGLALVVGQKALSAATADPAPVSASELTMPATVGDLVAVSGPEVGAQLVPVLGFGLRPAGVTVTGAYGTDPAGPVVLAAMATTVPAPTEAAGQLTAWAERTGATVAEPVPGSGASDGVTCAEVTENPAGSTGSVCVWTATGMNGLTYVVGTSPDSALATTADVRSGIQPAVAG